MLTGKRFMKFLREEQTQWGGGDRGGYGHQQNRPDRREDHAGGYDRRSRGRDGYGDAYQAQDADGHRGGGGYRDDGHRDDGYRGGYF